MLHRNYENNHSKRDRVKTHPRSSLSCKCPGMTDLAKICGLYDLLFVILAVFLLLLVTYGKYRAFDKNRVDL
jgi:hypothetical protein